MGSADDQVLKPYANSRPRASTIRSAPSTSPAMNEKRRPRPFPCIRVRALATSLVRTPAEDRGVDDREPDDHCRDQHVEHAQPDGVRSGLCREGKRSCREDRDYQALRAHAHECPDAQGGARRHPAQPLDHGLDSRRGPRRMRGLRGLRDCLGLLTPGFDKGERHKPHPGRQLEVCIHGAVLVLRGGQAQEVRPEQNDRLGKQEADHEDDAVDPPPLAGQNGERRKERRRAYRRDQRVKHYSQSFVHSRRSPFWCRLLPAR